MASFTGAIFYICAYPRESFLKTDFGTFFKSSQKKVPKTVLRIDSPRR